MRKIQLEEPSSWTFFILASIQPITTGFWIFPPSYRKRRNKHSSKKWLPSGSDFVRVLAIYFSSRASTDFWSADDIAIILLKSSTTSWDPLQPPGQKVARWQFPYSALNYRFVEFSLWIYSIAKLCFSYHRKAYPTSAKPSRTVSPQKSAPYCGHSKSR